MALRNHLQEEEPPPPPPAIVLCSYVLEVHTSGRPDGGSSAQLTAVLSGALGDTGEQPLQGAQEGCLHSGGVSGR